MAPVAAVGYVQEAQQRHAADLRRYASPQAIVVGKRYLPEAGTAADVAGDGAGEQVAPQVKVLEAAQGADARGDLPLQAVGAEVERSEEGEVAYGRGDGAIEPPEVEAQRNHPPPVAVATGDSFPAAVAGTAVPGGQHTGAPDDRRLEGFEGSSVAAMCNGVVGYCRVGAEQQEKWREVCAGSGEEKPQHLLSFFLSSLRERESGCLYKLIEESAATPKCFACTICVSLFALTVAQLVVFSCLQGPVLG